MNYKDVTSKDKNEIKIVLQQILKTMKIIKIKFVKYTNKTSICVLNGNVLF